MFKKKLKCIKIIIYRSYFKHIAKHIVYLVNFLSNVQLIKMLFQEKYEIIRLQINFYSLFIAISIIRK